MDVAIVGAGFAGLSAALTLRRHRCDVVVFDGGPPRNARAREVHGFLGADGLSGSELRDRACGQVRRVGGRIEPGRVVTVRQEGDGFAVALDGGGEWLARRLLLATGIRDRYPDIAGFFDFFGNSVHVCPHCDAYEWRDQPIAIVSWNEATHDFVRKVSNWSRRITVVTDGRSPEMSGEERAELERLGIGVRTGIVLRFEGEDGQLERLRFADGSELPARAAFFSIGEDYQSDLARQLGCRLRRSGAIRANDDGRTSVDGVWAAGDVVGSWQFIAVAVAQGMRAGLDIFESFDDTAA